MKLKTLAAVAFVASCVPLSASAAVITWNLSSKYNGATPTGAAPWTTVTLTDTAANTVTLKVQSALTGAEYINSVYLNLLPSFASALAFGAPVTTGSFNVPTVTRSSDAYAASTGGNFDVKIAFDTTGNNGNKRFSDADAYQVAITAAGLSTATFLTNSTGGAAAYPVAAFVEGAAGYITVAPEPATLAVAAAAAGVAMSRRRRRGA